MESAQKGLQRESQGFDARPVMSRIETAPEVFDDFDRFLDHIAQFDVGSAPERIAAIVEAVQILAKNPLMGRPVRGGMRELVIGRGSRGYVALYRYVAQIDTVFLLAVRSQRESGYKRGGGEMATQNGRAANGAAGERWKCACFVARVRSLRRCQDRQPRPSPGTGDHLTEVAELFKASCRIRSSAAHGRRTSPPCRSTCVWPMQPGLASPTGS